MEIFVPGQGMVSMEGSAVDRAINEYDERLFFARNDTTGQYTIFMKNVHGEAPIPVLAFEEIPSPEAALKRLFQTDARRHGLEILDRMRSENEREKKVFDDASSDAAGALAEAQESFYRNNGKTNYSTSYKLDGSRTAVKRG